MTFQIRQIVKGVKDGEALLEQYRKEGKLKLIPEAIKPKQKRRIRSVTKTATNGPEFKNQAVRYPTSNAPKYLANLDTPWKIAEALLEPWKIQQLFNSRSVQNDGCFRPSGNIVFEKYGLAYSVTTLKTMLLRTRLFISLLFIHKVLVQI